MYDKLMKMIEVQREVKLLYDDFQEGIIAIDEEKVQLRYSVFIKYFNNYHEFEIDDPIYTKVTKFVDGVLFIALKPKLEDK